MNHPLLHTYSDYDSGKSHLQGLGFEVEKFSPTIVGPQFAWVRVSDKLIREEDRQYFNRGTRVIANLEPDGSLLGLPFSNKTDDYYISLLRRNLPNGDDKAK
ncbi:hypothetical protein GOV12_06310 [Candidatus Pacearchaeota archaeon]|nr:hypothetical protein [Candidatus Pacearchaeota archaeon]